ncbi:unnamed protein product [Cuscuta epithymum]|uniref:Dof-type domain-containing protein n=1 Tax=Cuscuta epithymum TaxID=186058 RepID=A0AAV0FQJ4_9ASTE|nr:unnamed protein product [Cuscuta epithymum]CAH9137908.1 unnamed protein product [Cuscuta epithymum]
MAEVQDTHMKQGIKLFGATIITVDEEKKPNGKDDEAKRLAVEQHKRPDKVIPCPRCNSMETKFCYFNNYNVNQPRHFCKGCQRYWTAGGALRNVPVGAGRRKNKPPCPVINGLSEACLYDASGLLRHIDFDGTTTMTVDEWRTAEQGGFHLLSGKRSKISATH